LFAFLNVFKTHLTSKLQDGEHMLMKYFETFRG